jgi:hypothetical protein
VVIDAKDFLNLENMAMNIYVIIVYPFAKQSLQLNLLLINNVSGFILLHTEHNFIYLGGLYVEDLLKQSKHNFVFSRN